MHVYTENDKDKVRNRVGVLCSYCQLVEVQEVSGGREGLVELSDLCSHRDRVLQTERWQRGLFITYIRYDPQCTLHHYISI